MTDQIAHVARYPRAGLPVSSGAHAVKGPDRCYASPRTTISVDARPVAVGNGNQVAVFSGKIGDEYSAVEDIPVYGSQRDLVNTELARMYVDQVGVNRFESKPTPMFSREIQNFRDRDFGLGQGTGVTPIQEVRCRELVSKQIPLAIRDPDISTNTEPPPDAITVMANRIIFLESLENDPKKREMLKILYREITAHGQFLLANRNNIGNITDASSVMPKMQKVRKADGKEYLRLTPYVDVKEAKITIDSNGDIKIRGIKNQDIESIGAQGFIDTHRNGLFFKVLFWGLVASFILFFLYMVAKFFSWLFCTDSCSGCNKKQSRCSC